MSQRTHHLHHLHLCIQAQVVEEHLEIFLHLDRVVVHLGHREDSHLALPPHLQRQEVHQDQLNRPESSVDLTSGRAGDSSVK